MTVLKILFGSPAAAFAWFAILIAMRDISAELFLDEDPVSLAFLVSSTIVLLSLGMVFVRGSFFELVEKLKRPGAMWRASVLGIVSGGIYGGLFYLIGHMGAGLFNLIDYGLIPIATAATGIIFFKERLRWELVLACFVYLVGLVLLMAYREMFGASLIFFALFCPFATAASDGLTKWLLDPGRGNLSRPQLLIVRFLPAAFALALFAYFGSGKGLQIVNIPGGLLVSVLFGWLPLYLLCTGLGREGLARLASFEFIIPGIAFFGTLAWHWEESARPLPLLGACLVLSGIFVSEAKLFGRSKTGSRESPPAVSVHQIKAPAKQPLKKAS